MALAAGLLLSVTPLSAAAENVFDDTVHVVEPGQYDVLLELRGSERIWLDANLATIHNLSAETQTFRFGATAWDPGVVESLWDAPFFDQFAQVEIPAGQTHSQPFPDWPGVDFHFYRDTPEGIEEVAVATSADQHVPVRFTGSENLDEFTWQIGRTVTTSVDPARAGESIVVRAGEIEADEVGVYFVPENEFIDELQSLGELALDPATGGFAEYLGTAPVVGGAVAALVTIPSGTVPGAYAVLLDSGDAALWQAGPPLTLDYTGDSEQISARNLLVEAGPTRTTTAIGDDVVVVPVDAGTGESIFDFGFQSVTAAGDTTVSSTNTLPEGVPAPTTFTALTDPPVYYLLDTTAEFEGQIELCVRVAGLSEAEFTAVGLYHYVDGLWEQIGEDWAYDDVTGVGLICGTTLSLSPFALGIANPPWPFIGFQHPVDNGGVLNSMKAGAAVPITFGLGGFRALDILSAGSPSSERVTCGTTTPVDAIEVTTTAGASALRYDPGTDTYTYVWKTNKSWGGTCRQFTLSLTDGSAHTALFSFK